jgi:hypothetical protein
MDDCETGIVSSSVSRVLYNVFTTKSTKHTKSENKNGFFFVCFVLFVVNFISQALLIEQITAHESYPHHQSRV